MAALTIFCKGCHAGYAATGAIPSVCPACEHDAGWTTRWPHEDRRFPFVVTKQDRRFLRSLRIASDEDPAPAG